uniref:Uncharacterized protein n=1 Tax=Cucumis melo TaxID=3656 RepID=A0A9I9E022_CUCME
MEVEHLNVLEFEVTVSMMDRKTKLANQTKVDWSENERNRSRSVLERFGSRVSKKFF